MSNLCGHCHTNVGQAEICRGCGAEYRRHSKWLGTAIFYSVLIGFAGFFIGMPWVPGILAFPFFIYFGFKKKWVRTSNRRFDS